MCPGILINRTGHILCKSHYYCMRVKAHVQWVGLSYACDCRIVLVASFKYPPPPPPPPPPPQWSHAVNVWIPSRLQMACSDMPEEEEEGSSHTYSYYD